MLLSFSNSQVILFDWKQVRANELHRERAAADGDEKWMHASLSLSDLIHNTELPLIVLRRASLCAVEWIKASSFKKREGQHAPHPFGNDVLPNMHANNQQACL
jgi:hypothetical protein